VGALRAEAIGVDVQPKSAASRPKTAHAGRLKITDLTPTA
jgi:hypothetical protein